MSGLLEAALGLARGSWAVLPCNPETKAPLTKHGHLEATRGEDIIREWWEKWPHAIIGAKVPDSLLVIDIDPRNGGSVEALVEAVGPLPETLTVISGRGDGGAHHYFKRPLMERMTGARLPEGIDLKVNGYCIVPPSPHPATGKPYVWAVKASPVALPTRLETLITPDPPRIRPAGSTLESAEGLVVTVRNSPEGERNALLYWAACRALEQGADEKVIGDLVDAARAAGLTEREAQRTVASARQMTGGSK